MTDSALEQFRAAFHGDVIAPDDPGFDTARRVHNGLIDRHPALVVHPRGVAAVAAAARFGRDLGLPIAIRGGSHSVAGHGTCDGGMVIDLSLMRGVRIDPDTRRAWVQGGALLGDVDRESQLYGLAVPAGQVSNTGVAGLTLNGGMGCMQRKHGLTCDNLLSVELVTAAGEVVRASQRDNPELFWALRGGGGNFGVVTSFEFQLHPVGPMVYAGLVAYPIEQAPEVLAFFRDFIADAPEELSADVIFQLGPPLDIVPEELRGSRLVGIFIRYMGPPEEGEKIVRPIQEFGDPVLDFVGPAPFVEVQSILDPLNPRGWRNYWTAEYIAELGDDEIRLISKQGGDLPSHASVIQVIPFNGAVTRIPADATAFAHREESWLIHYLAQWEDPADTEACRVWAKTSGAALRTHGTGDVYLNLITDDEDTDRVAAFWNDERMRRLAAVKAAYDPDNVFRFNHNITPAAPEATTPEAVAPEVASAADPRTGREPSGK